MRIAVGSDHAGYELKEQLAAYLRDEGHDVEDLGTDNGTEPVDYPDYGAAVGRSVAAGDVELGLCVCGTGIGISMAADKIPGIRAAAVHDVTTARLAREHNHANVVCFGARTTGETTALDALGAFLAAVPQGGRHEVRIAKLAELDRATSLAGEGAR
jgi:RpiB/LacA/LacB family sugar-phosphate isomerase